ncbi:MAG: transcriptional repressor [Pirellulaceae bacterium]|nr:transcriptional repressor [Pirellulaceae bacterium]
MTDTRSDFHPGVGGEISTEEIKQWLKSNKLRCTSARIAVLKLMARSQFPLSHAEIADELMPGGFDKSTIFRSLQELSKKRLIRKIDLGDQVRRYELALPAGENGSEEFENNHSHFMCTSCNKVLCLGNPPLKELLSQNVTIYKIQEVLLKGICSECR